MSIEPFTFTTLIPQGYKLLPATPDQAEYEHSLFGAQAITGAWCPNCDKPLLHLASIDTRDPRLGLAHLSLTRIPLLYCMRCCISWADGDVNTAGLQQHRQACACGIASDDFVGRGCEFHYHVSDSEGVSILVYNEGYDEEYLPYPDYPGSFPDTPIMLQPINEQELWYCQRANRWQEEHPAEFTKTEHEPGEMVAFYEAKHATARAFDEESSRYLTWTHQLGSEPGFWNPPSPLACPCCGDEMPFLAMIEDNASAGTPDLSGGEGGQITFHFCQGCSIIGAYVIIT